MSTSREKYHAKMMEFLDQDDWLSGGIQVAKTYTAFPLDWEIKDTCALIFGAMLHQHPDFKPRTSEEFMWRGICLRRDRDKFETLRDFGRAVKLKPRNHFALKWRAWSLVDFYIPDFYCMAKEDLVKAISICPLSEYCDDLAQIYVLEKDHESTLYYNLKAVELFTDREPGWKMRLGRYHYEAALSYLILRRYDEAADMLNKTLELRPDYDKAKVFLQKIADLNL